MGKIYNRGQETNLRKKLRSKTTKPEIILWSKLKEKQLGGYKFRRQYSIGPYVVDFYCPKARLAIEADGPIHRYKSNQEYDQQRQHYIESFGISFLRFTNADILNRPEVVIQKIQAHLNNHKGGVSYIEKS